MNTAPKTPEPLKPGQGIAAGLTWLGCGLITYFFPIYANIRQPWPALFELTSYFFYALAVLTAIGDVNIIKHSEILRGTIESLTLFLLSVGIHQLARTINSQHPYASTALEFLTLFTAYWGVVFFAGSIPLAIEQRRNVEKSDAASTDNTTALRTDHLVAIAIAIISLATAVIQLARAFLAKP